MGQLEPKVIEQRSNAAWTMRDKWRSILQEAYEMVFAGINPYIEDRGSPRVMNKQFDSTAVGGVIRLANRIVNDMTPPDQNWADVKVGPLLELQYSQEELDQLREPLSKASKMANIVVNSGQAVAARKAAMVDVIIAGMGCVLTLDDATDDVEPIIDVAVSQSEVAIEEDAKGRISGIYRKRRIKVRNIKGLWDDADIPADLLKKQADSKDKDIEVNVLEVSYKDDLRAGVGWYYEILYCDKAKDPVRMVKRVYENCPWTIWRWMKLPGIPYGPGPVLLGLADIRTANKVLEMILKNAALALAGMYLVKDDGVVNPDNIMISAGGLIPVQSTGGTQGASMVPLTTNREFDIGQVILEDLRKQIKKHLFDTSLPPEQGNPRSATEIIQRIKELNQDIGIGIGQLSEDTKNYVRSRLEMLSRRGMVPKFKIDQFTLKIEINAPLMRAQKMSEVENVLNWYQMAVQLGGPQAAMIVGKLEQIIFWMAEQMNVPTDLVRPENEQGQFQQQMAAAAIQQSTEPAMQQAL